MNGKEIVGGVAMMITNISNPVNKNINSTDCKKLGNFLSFQMKIRLPIIPLITVEMEHGNAVGPPRVNLYAEKLFLQVFPR